MPTEIMTTSIHLIGIEDLRRRWGWFVGLGILLVIAGTISLSASAVLTIASMLFVGSLMLLMGAMQAIHALATRRWGGFFVDLMVGLLSGAAGLLMILHPESAAEALTLLIALFLILGGVFRIALAIAIPFDHTRWLAIHGIINLMLGVLIIQQWPVSGLWVIGLFIGIDMICNGWTLIMLGLMARKTRLT